jgi:hypothetical protein
METEKCRLAAPCGLYCGVCAIHIAHRDDNLKFKERLTGLYGVGLGDLHCNGCLSDDVFLYCRVCPIKACTAGKGIAGCHQCADFPCAHIETFAFPVGRKVMLRSIPARRELGDEQWMEEEEKRYRCPRCGIGLFRGAKRCRSCGEATDMD